LRINKISLIKFGFDNYDLRSELYNNIRHLIEKYPLPNEKKNALEEIKIPQRFLCPVTHKIMNDPVIAFDKHTYERNAILEYLKQNHQSPLTNKPCGNDPSSMMVFRNLQLKQEIDAFKKVHNL